MATSKKNNKKAVKKATVKKAVKKAPAKKVVKKPAAKKVVTKKPVKKTVTKKVVTKKPATKKVAVKKVVKKAPIKKAAVKKTDPKKVVKKVVSKKPAKKVVKVVSKKEKALQAKRLAKEKKAKELAAKKLAKEKKAKQLEAKKLAEAKKAAKKKEAEEKKKAREAAKLAAKQAKEAEKAAKKAAKEAEEAAAAAAAENSFFDYDKYSSLPINELKKEIVKAKKKKIKIKQSDINKILEDFEEDKDTMKFLKFLDKNKIETIDDEEKSDIYRTIGTNGAGDDDTFNPVSMYLRESHNPKFTKEQELDLFKRISKGDQDALDEIYNANRLLVFKCAKDIYKNNKSLPLENLIAAGNFGLIKAIEKFEWQKNNKLSTYATYWINQSIRRTLSDKGRLVRIPVHMGDKISKMKKANRLLAQELGRAPTDKEIAERMNKDEKEKAKRNGKKTNKADYYNEDKIKELRNYSHQIQSLDKKVNNGSDDDESSQIDFVEQVDELTPADYDKQENSKKAINDILHNQLSDKEEQIIRYRWGLFEDDEKKYTLDEVGSLMGLTRERIRQIEGKALKKIKSPKNIKLLQSLIKQ